MAQSHVALRAYSIRQGQDIRAARCVGFFPTPALSLGERVNHSLRGEQSSPADFPLRDARCSLSLRERVRVGGANYHPAYRTILEVSNWVSPPTEPEVSQNDYEYHFSMKVTIIGGGGRVGSCAAFALQCAGLVAEIQILDANKDMADGEALDLLHGSAFTGDQKIYSGDYARAADSDTFLITAGLRRKPDESRLDLINRNVVLFVQILDSIKSAGLRKYAHVFVVSNPVDILTQLAVQRLGLPWQQVYGLGTMLDTSRFSSFIADELMLAPTQVKALILGEHG